jgi:ribonuclease VapC
VTRVLDSSAVLAVVLGEPGAERVTPHLAAARLGTVNLAEVMGILVRRGADEATARRSILALMLTIVPLDQGLAFAVGRLEAQTRALGLSLGDRACLALAAEAALPILTSDRRLAAFAPKLDLTVELVR